MTIFEGLPPEGVRPVKGAKLNAKKPVEKAGKTSGPGPSDKVQLSGKAKEINELMGQVEALPEVREAKVQDLRNAISKGAYSVDSQKIAGKMLDEVV